MQFPEVPGIDEGAWTEARRLYGFTATFLAARYDEPRPIPDFHLLMWALCFSKKKQVAIAAPRGHAKCCSGDTLVSMSDGTRKAIRDVQVGDLVASVDRNHRFKDSRVSRKVHSGLKECLKIRTRSGREVVVTPDHRVMTFDGMRVAGSLAAGEDYIASPRLLPEVERVPCRSEHVRLVAYMIAEGSLSSGNTKFTNFDAAVVRDMKRCCRALGFGFRRIKRGQYNITGARDYFREHGLYGHTALTKRIPEWVYQLPDAKKWEFLSCLWDTDGWFAVKAGQAGITLANEPLIDDIRELLLRVGINSSKVRRPNEKAGAWALRIDNGRLTTFISHLNLLAKADRANLLLGKARYSLIDVYPNRIKKLRVNVERDFRENRVARVDNRCEITRGKMSRMVAYDPVPGWVRAEDADVFWDRVESIESVGEVDTYDIECWSYGNFVGDGVVMHNSTAITFAYVIYMLLFRKCQHVLILGANESLANSFLNDIKVELLENDEVRRQFGVDRFQKDTESELICGFKDGHKFRILCKGAGQRMRGVKWERKRPDLVIFDDMEDEDQVMNEQRREKFRKWFTGTVAPILSHSGIIRGVGTIIGFDSFLERCMPPEKSAETVKESLFDYSEDKSRAWLAMKFRAHNPDFSEILWPEHRSEEWLKAERKAYAEIGQLDIYGQEYLNFPVDESVSYYRKTDFRPMKDGHHEIRKTYYAGVDLAIGEKQRNAYSVIVVGGLDLDGNLHIVDVRRGRWDSLQIVEEFFSVQQRWDIDTFRVESENIAKAIGPFLYRQMDESRIYLNIDDRSPTKDKDARGRSMQARMRAGKVYFDSEAEWYPDFLEELTRYPKHPFKDQFDAFSWLGLMLDEMVEPMSDEEYEDEIFESQFETDFIDEGRDAMTGY